MSPIPLHASIGIALAAPAALLAVLALSSLLGRPLSESLVGRLTGAAVVASLAAELGALTVHLAGGGAPVVLSYGTWFSGHEGTFTFDFLIDGPSIAFAILSTAICGVVSAFSFRYLHREPGFNRYFVLFAAFFLGITLVALAGSVEVLFAGLAGAATALYATLTARVQPDVKSALAYASLTQVGLIVVEIALGLYTLALVHLAGHACFRLLQLLSAPNVLHDLHELESTGAVHPRGPSSLHPALYLFLLERGFADELLDRLIVRPFRRITAALDRLDRRTCELLDRGRRSP